jgi:hypothetical protein
MRSQTAAAQHRFQLAILVSALAPEPRVAERKETGIRTYLTGSTTWAPAPGWPRIPKPKVKPWRAFKAARPRPGGSR